MQGALRGPGAVVGAGWGRGRPAGGRGAGRRRVRAVRAPAARALRRLRALWGPSSGQQVVHCFDACCTSIPHNLDRVRQGRAHMKALKRTCDLVCLQGVHPEVPLSYQERPLLPQRGRAAQVLRPLVLRVRRCRSALSSAASTRATGRPTSRPTTSGWPCCGAPCAASRQKPPRPRPRPPAVGLRKALAARRTAPGRTARGAPSARGARFAWRTRSPAGAHGGTHECAERRALAGSSSRDACKAY